MLEGYTHIFDRRDVGGQVSRSLAKVAVPRGSDRE